MVGSSKGSFQTHQPEDASTRLQPQVVRDRRNYRATLALRLTGITVATRPLHSKPPA